MGIRLVQFSQVTTTVTYEGHALAQDPGIAIMRIHKKRSIF